MTTTTDKEQFTELKILREKSIMLWYLYVFGYRALDKKQFAIMVWGMPKWKKKFKRHSEGLADHVFQQSWQILTAEDGQDCLTRSTFLPTLIFPLIKGIDAWCPFSRYLQKNSLMPCPGSVQQLNKDCILTSSQCRRRHSAKQNDSYKASDFQIGIGKTIEAVYRSVQNLWTGPRTYC